MSICHECGEQIAEIDIYCPHCGISVQPVNFETDLVDPPESAERPEIEEPPGQIGTVDDTAVSPARIAELPLDEPTKSFVDINPADIVDQAGALIEQKSSDFAESVTEENIDLKTESVEMPPVFLQTEAAADLEQMEPQPGISGDLPETDLDDQMERAFNEADEEELPDNAAAGPEDDNSENTGADSGPDQDQPDLILSEAGVAEDQTPSEETVAHEDIEPEIVDAASDEPLVNDIATLDSSQEEIPAEQSGDSGQFIGKPDTDLELEDTSPGLSEFDSVRIIESSAESFEESLRETDATPMAAAPPESSDPISGNLPQDDQGAFKDSRESRSYTSPIVSGRTDTDGKKSKLKPLGEGTVLNGRYEVVRKIGGGGMGAVYLASDKNLGGVLRAVKEMVQSYIEEDQQAKAISDFKRESLLLTTLEHPAIPTIYDYFFDEKECRFYLVMKYINGGDLASRLRSAPDGRIEERSVAEWAAQIADVLDYLHKREPPIVYRDLKPANIMIDGNSGRAMLIDFGIARWINKEEKGVTAVGTMGYAPPELFSGNVEPRSDIYSLGSTMFHLLTGADPQSNPLLIFDFQKNPRPRQINPQLSDQIERILMQSVEYNAEKRIASSEKMRQELEQHLENLNHNRVTFGVNASPVPLALSDETVFCGFCGQGIVASDLFCAFCGAKQPIAQQGVHGEYYVTTPQTAKLMVIGTNDLESPIFTIEKDENLVGRRDPMSNIFPEVDLSKYDPQTKISRRHARIWRDGNSFMVEDLGSSNGTLLVPVVSEAFRLPPNQPHLLTNGDKLKLGDTTLHFVLG